MTSVSAREKWSAVFQGLTMLRELECKERVEGEREGEERGRGIKMRREGGEEKEDCGGGRRREKEEKESKREKGDRGG